MDEGSLEHCYMGGRSSCGHGTDNNSMTAIQSMTTLWERTVASDSGLFQLQYMDLSEFLTENGMSMHEAQLSSQSSRCPSTSSCSSSSPSSASAASPTTVDMLGAGNCLNHSPQSSLEPSSSPTCPPLTTPPMSNSGDLLVTFDPDIARVDLSSVPSQDDFDPQTQCFSEEDLKPQPVIKKAQKMLVPDNLKDDKYWSRRWKNNEAAKRSRDARRLKENQILVRASFLERENAALRQEVANMRKELSRCRTILNKYEGN